MSSIRPGEIEAIKNGRYQRQLVFPLCAAWDALPYVREDIDLVMLCIGGANFDSDISRCLLVQGKPGRGECTMSELVHYLIPIAKSIVDMDWMITARSVITQMLYLVDVSILNGRRRHC